MKLLQQIKTGSLSEQLSQVDEEFRVFMQDLAFKRDGFYDKLKTFSPLDAVASFEHKGIHAVAEISRDEILANENGFTKSLANMLAQCKPGALSDDDLNQITGINGREMSL